MIVNLVLIWQDSHWVLCVAHRILPIVSWLFLFISGENPPDPEASVICNYNHTVTITIRNVDDIREWEADEWQLLSNPECEPTLYREDQIVKYYSLKLPDCAYDQIQLDNGNIQYVLKVRAEKPDPGPPGQLRAYNHMYYVSCEYDTHNRSTAYFIPIVNRENNATGKYNIQQL